MRADNRKLGGDLRKSRALFGKTFRGIGRGIKGALSMAMSPLGVGAGAIGFAAIGKEVLDFEQTLVDIQVQGNASAETMDKLRSTINELSKDNAQAKPELSALAMEMVNLEGVAGLSAEKLQVLADAAFASSSPVNELAGLSLALGNAFDLVDPTNLKAGLDSIIVAGKAGSIPLAEMNILLQQSGAEFAKFSGKGIDGATKMAATLQTLRKQAGSAGEAGTRLSALLGVFATRETELGKFGIRVKDLAGNYREVSDIVADIDASGIVNDADKYNLAFGKRKEARLALETLIDIEDQYRENLAIAQKGGAIDADMAARRQTDAFKIKKAFNDAKIALAEAFTPDRIKKFADLMGTMADTLGFMVDHAEAFVAIWAAFKIAGLVSGFASMAASAASIAASSGAASAGFGGMAAGFGKMALRAAPIAAAAYGVLKLDKELGVTDSIADKLVNNAPGYDKNLMVRAGATSFNQSVIGNKTGGMVGEKVTDSQLAFTARDFIGDARNSGVVGANGVDREAAFLATHDTEKGTGLFDKAKASGFEDELTNAMVSALDRAAKIVAEDERKKSTTDQEVKVRLSIDDYGILRERRSPQ